MQSLWDKYSCVPGLGVCVFDPVSLTAAVAAAATTLSSSGALTAGTMAITAAGAGLSAEGTLASGNAQKVAGQMQQSSANYQADQEVENASGEIGASQRTMLDTQLRTSMTQSKLTAAAAGSGINAAVGSPLAASSAIAKRGQYQSMMDLWNGQNKSTGDLNLAAGLRYGGAASAIGGEEAQTASELSASGTLASGLGSVGKIYSGYAYPNLSGRPS